MGHMTGTGVRLDPWPTEQPAKSVGDEEPVTAERPAPKSERPAIQLDDKLKGYLLASKRAREEAQRGKIMKDKIEAAATKFKADSEAILAKARELHDDQEAEANGLVPKYTPTKRQALRDGLRTLLNTADSETKATIEAVLEEARNGVHKARAEAAEGLDAQERIAAMMEADYLARTAKPDDLLAKAQAALARQDAVGASLALKAARLAANGKPLKGVDTLAQEVDKALDEAVPARKAAQDRLREAWLAHVEAATQRFQAQREALNLLGYRSEAATASVGAKLAAREAQGASS